MSIVETKYTPIDREELARLRADSAELARLREPISNIEIHNIAFEIAATDDRGGYYFEPDDLEKFVAELRPIPEGFALVPVEVKSDAERLEWLMESDALIAKLLSSGEQHYRLEWPDTEEFQRYWYKSPRQAIDEAMLAAAPKGDSHE